MRYNTRRDAIRQVIAPAIDGGDYDVEAICRDAFEYHIDLDELGNELLNTAGYVQVVAGDEFWEIVKRHAK